MEAVGYEVLEGKAKIEEKLQQLVGEIKAKDGKCQHFAVTVGEATGNGESDSEWKCEVVRWRWRM